VLLCKIKAYYVVSANNGNASLKRSNLLGKSANSLLCKLCQAIAPNKAHYCTCCRNMGVGRIFSKLGQLWIFLGVAKMFFQKGQKWWNFILPSRD